MLKPQGPVFTQVPRRTFWEAEVAERGLYVNLGEPFCDHNFDHPAGQIITEGAYKPCAGRGPVALSFSPLLGCSS